MKHHIIIGLNHREAQSYAMRFKEEHRGHRVELRSVDSVKGGCLRGLAGDHVEIIVLPRAWGHEAAITLGLEVEVLEQRGVRVVTADEE